MTVTAAPTTLRQRAIAAWQVAQEGQAVELAAQSEQQRANLRMIANNLAVKVGILPLTAPGPYEVGNAARIQAEGWTVFGSDASLRDKLTSCTAEAVIDGERFEVRHGTGLSSSDEHGWHLYHRHICVTCGRESSSWELDSLEDFGRWLERATVICGHVFVEVSA